jgi:hypothetical protein
MNQSQKVLKHLHNVGSISGLEAGDLYRVRDLPKRISELRAQGIDIDREWRSDLLGGRYKRYRLAKI